MTTATSLPATGHGRERFRLSRAGVLNVWQYDDQVFDLADGRLLLRGANGAGKSKTLEMLLPFALDGDKARITASSKHHTSLLWLMTDGLESGNRIGYIWVEFERPTAGGSSEVYTCGVGIRASTSARQATAWHFVTDRRVGQDLELEDDAGPLSMPRLKEVLGDEHVFERAPEYKAHVGRTLFGLDAAQYDEVLRLLYWLRQPQVGEDIEPARFARQLSQALPQLDEQAVRTAGDTFDELIAFGDQIERRASAATALGALAEAYTGYARAVVAERAGAVVAALRRERGLRRDVTRARAAVDRARDELRDVQEQETAARQDIGQSEARLRALEASPEFRDQRRLHELAEKARRDTEVARREADRHERRAGDVARLDQTAGQRAQAARRGLDDHEERLGTLDRRLRDAVPGAGLAAVPSPRAEAVDDLSVRAAIEGDLARDATALDEAGAAVRRRQAAVALVREAVDQLELARAALETAEGLAASAEARWEHSRGLRVEAERIEAAEQSALLGALGTWAASPTSPGVDVPDRLDDEIVLGLAGFAHAAAEPRRRELSDDSALRKREHRAATDEIERLRHERDVVASQREPAPPDPPLPRTERPDGLALWQVVDFADGVDASTGARIEAALQGSGLLDAWIRPGGRLLGVEHLDVVVDPADPPTGGTTLAGYLVPDLPVGCDVVVDDVRRVLAAIGAGEHDDGGRAWIGEDGGWRLGPTRGRAAKERAQFVGATARAEERARRLRLLDDQITEQQKVAGEADAARVALERLLGDLGAWVRAVPSGSPLVSARTHAASRREVEQADE